MEMEYFISRIQIHYNNLNKKYSKSYLSGSPWYVGDDLHEWWFKKCNHIRYYYENKKKLMFIVEILKTDLENEVKIYKQ